MNEEIELLSVLQKRRMCRHSLAAWARFNGFEPAKHHLLIIDKLEAVVRGEIPRLMILVPPGSAKSTYTSKLFPPWFLGQHPGNSILACSYSFTLVERFGKHCRELITKHQQILGYGLSKHSQAAGDWATTTDSVYFAAGVGAGIAGHRADLALIDDYLGTQEDADSQLIRDKQWDWYWNDLWPRLKPTATQIIIANRRHEDDLVGRLLAKEAQKWTVIRLPMLAEDNDPLGRILGERLWPEWFTEDMVSQARSLPRVWAGLYQQRPAPEEGELFKKDCLMSYTASDLESVLRTGLRIFCSSDHALKLKQENDRTVMLVGGVDTIGRLWILPSWFWGKAPTDVVVEKMLDIAALHKPIRWFTGSDHITGSIGPFLTKRMIERNVYFPLEEMSNVKDKVAKAQSIIGRVGQKMVMFPTYAPDWDKALHEILTFPNGTHDDFVDALSELGRGLGSMTPMHITKVKESFDRNAPFMPTFDWVKASNKRVLRSAKLLSMDN